MCERGGRRARSVQKAKLYPLTIYKGVNKVNKNLQDKDEDLRFKTRHLLQLVEWVKNTLDLQVGDHHHHLGEKL